MQDSPHLDRPLRKQPLSIYLCVCVACLCPHLKGTQKLALSPAILLQLGLILPLLAQLTVQPQVLILKLSINKPELTIKTGIQLNLKEIPPEQLFSKALIQTLWKITLISEKQRCGFVLVLNMSIDTFATNIETFPFPSLRSVWDLFIVYSPELEDHLYIALCSLCTDNNVHHFN